jgi:hypothetical protein
VPAPDARQPPPVLEAWEHIKTNVTRLQDSPRQNRLCWVSQKHAEEWPCRRRLQASGAEAMPLVKDTPMAREIDSRNFVNRICVAVMCSYAVQQQARGSRAVTE